MNRENDRVLLPLPAFLLGLFLGVGGTWLLLRRNAPPAAAEAAGANTSLSFRIFPPRKPRG